MLPPNVAVAVVVAVAEADAAVITTIIMMAAVEVVSAEAAVDSATITPTKPLPMDLPRSYPQIFRQPRRPHNCRRILRRRQPHQRQPLPQPGARQHPQQRQPLSRFRKGRRRKSPLSAT